MPKKPTQAEIQKAKEYVRDRLHAQGLTEAVAEHEFDVAAEEIAAIILKYKTRGMRLRFTGTSPMAKEIRAVLERLVGEIEAAVLMNAVPDEASDEVNDMIIEEIMGEDHGFTYKERETHYVAAFLKILAAINFSIADMDEESIIEAIRDEAGKIERRITTLATNTVAVGWSKYNEYSNSKDAIGFFVIQGSNNPCEFCRGMFNKFHPMTDPMPTYHPNCCCGIVFVYA